MYKKKGVDQYYSKKTEVKRDTILALKRSMRQKSLDKTYDSLEQALRVFFCGYYHINCDYFRFKNNYTINELKAEFAKKLVKEETKEHINHLLEAFNELKYSDGQKTLAQLKDLIATFKIIVQGLP